MKKIDFKFSKRQAILTTAFIAVLSVGVVSVGALSSNEPKASVDSLEHVTEHVSAQPTPEPTEIAQNTAPEVQTTTQPAVVTTEVQAPQVVEQTVYEKYGVDETTVKMFEQNYPDYANYNHDLFISNIATILKANSGDPSVFLEHHVSISGIRGMYGSNKAAEKNSFIQLIISNNYGLSFEPWSTVL